MNSKLWVAVAVTTAALGAAGCHDSGGGSAPAPVSSQPVPQFFDTSKVLALAQQTSETSSPIVINGGLVVLDDASETTSPIFVNVM